MYRAGWLVPMILVAACGRGPEGIEEGDCADGEDNDGDALVDCEDDGCRDDARCVAQRKKARAAEKAAERARLEAEQARLEAEREKARRPFFEWKELWVQRGHNGRDIAHAGARAYCDKLELGGADDWRLPTAEEAVKLAESEKLTPEPYAMWTSTKRGRKRGVIVGITSAAANELGLVYDGQCRARCVREK
jgi:hypothetical protein